MIKITLIEKAFLLKKTSMFKTLDLDLLLPIADRLSPQKIAANEVIFGLNEQGYSLYIIADGIIEIKREGKPIVRLEKGEVFGDESLFNSQPRAYSTLSKTETTLLILSFNDLLAILFEYPKAALGFLEAYATVLPCRASEK